MQGSSRETAHSWGIVGTQLENHREQGANSRDSERQQQGRRECFLGGPSVQLAKRQLARWSAQNPSNQHIVIHQRSSAIAFFIPFRQ